MGSKERREREREEVRTRILDAARELFVEEGFEAVSMRKLAERIEYSATALYHHFPDKESLFRSVCLADYVAFGERFAKVAATPDPLERLRRLGEVYIAFAAEHPQHYRFLFMTDLPPEQAECGPGDPEIDPAQDAYAILRATCAEAIAKGMVRPGLDDPETMSQIAWAGVHGLASLWILQKDNPKIAFRPATQTIPALLDVLLDGFRAGARA